MAFRKGESGNLGGRPKGAANKATRDVRALATRLLSDPKYRRNLRQRLREGTAGQVEVLLHHYAYGKPREHVQIEARDIPPLVIQVIDEVRDWTGDADQ